MPSRDAFIYIPSLLKIIFYVASFITLFIFSAGLYSRLSIWMKGKEEASDPLSGKGFFWLLIMSVRYFFSKDCLLAKRVIVKSRLRGLMLIFTYWGFTALFAGTLIVGLDHYLSLGILRGYFYLIFSLILDLSGTAVFTGTSFFILRRIFKSKDLVSGWDDLPVLLLLLIIIISGFSVEGARLAIMHPESMDWSPVGAIIAGMLKEISNPSIYILFWSIHVVFALIFIAFIPFSKQFHMFAAQITTQVSYRENSFKRLVHD